MLAVRMTSFSTVVNRLVFYGRKPTKVRRMLNQCRSCTRPSLVLVGTNCQNRHSRTPQEVVS
jgi:hypothetical protein